MIPYPDIKPYLIKVGSLQVRWYGLMYILGFISSYILVNYQIKKRDLQIEKKLIDDLYFYAIIGLLVGARIGYVLFYNLPEYLKNPFEILAVWHGGLSFHGGLIGVLLLPWIYTQKKKLDFWLFSDLFIVTAPIGLGLGRVGNFINGELYGRVTDLPWAMVFPDGKGLPRHPSQLYEALFEGAVLFVILWLLKERIKLRGGLSALFLVLYGVIRVTIEFFREPDPQLGFILSFLTMGQILSIFMIGVGGFLFFFKYRKEKMKY